MDSLNKKTIEQNFNKNWAINTRGVSKTNMMMNVIKVHSGFYEYEVKSEDKLESDELMFKKMAELTLSEFVKLYLNL